MAVTFDAGAKAWLISGLMKIGLFQASVPSITASSLYKDQLPLPEIVFNDGNGHRISLSSLQGKVVFINFWATWCPPCIAEMPTINKLYHKFIHDKGIVFLMVDVDGKYAASKKFMERNKYNLPVYTAVGDIPSVFLRGAIPTTVILNKEGKMMLRHEGGADYDNPGVEKLLRELINR
jgi:thiol-disulfide isomerase/thioredoxin